MPPERLARFFAKEDEVYRVRPELRDRVVFAPQNVLQDPPFSRLDVATCRNLLIYLEPEVQQRVLALLHFGLREGGASVPGFERDGRRDPRTCSSRSTRRRGSTGGSARRGTGRSNSRCRTALLADDGGGGLALGGVPRALASAAQWRESSVAQLTQRTLLDGHTPAAVTVDRDGRIVYYHGDTRPFLEQLSGEPTRDLMHLAREGVRGAVRTALHRAAAESAEGHRARRLGGPGAGPPRAGRGHGIARRGRLAMTRDGLRRLFRRQLHRTGRRRNRRPRMPRRAALEEPADELHRLRAELQGTIEELQSSATRSSRPPTRRS